MPLKNHKAVILVENIFNDHEFCTDEKLVTSRTPDDLPAFMRTLIELAAAGDSTD